MEEEIDLRAYIKVLLRHWLLIAGLAVLLGIVAFVLAITQPDTYEASAVLMVTEPRYQLQFDPRYDTEDVKPAARAFPTLATSDGVLQMIVDTYTPPPEARVQRWSFATLSGMVHASSEGDPTLVVLTVRSRSPQAAAEIANVWAAALVERGNDIYGQGESDVLFFEQQALQAEQALAHAESTLVEFEAQNKHMMLQAELDSLYRAQGDYLASQRTVTYLAQDLQSLRTQWANQTSGEGTALADGLTALLFQVRAFNAQPVQSEESTNISLPPIQLQITDAGAFSSQSQEEQIAFLDNLEATLAARATEVEGLLTGVEPQVLSLQQQVQETMAAEDRLIRKRDVARETYITLARKLDEARIVAQEEKGALQVGSTAIVPPLPVGPRRLFNTLVAAVVGALLGVVAAFAVEFWRQGRTAGANTAIAAGD